MKLRPEKYVGEDIADYLNFANIYDRSSIQQKPGLKL